METAETLERGANICIGQYRRLMRGRGRKKKLRADLEKRETRIIHSLSLSLSIIGPSHSEGMIKCMRMREKKKENGEEK